MNTLLPVAERMLLDIPTAQEDQLSNLRESGLGPRIAGRSISFEAMRGMVARGLGYTVPLQRPPVDISYEGCPGCRWPSREESAIAASASPPGRPKDKPGN
ncbi:hypothetical protein [Arthrobacter sp. H35-D1]|uniref:hypothetical protein n=1 Tax=Arthrobacter sp. H35-D1 TaxID=3046202 RepID=UPI0024BAB93C|nr:hypothetical protein [Arthrobacter sp. H35-D1]MDJ0315453.1 hypothetical protein [Arthrobacter sp. H35-D1]